MPGRASLSRSAHSDPRGKITERIDCPVPLSVKEDATFVARARGFTTTAEWVRSVIYRELYGSVSQIQSVVRGEGPGDGGNQG